MKTPSSRLKFHKPNQMEIYSHIECFIYEDVIYCDPLSVGFDVAAGPGHVILKHDIIQWVALCDIIVLVSMTHNYMGN